MRAVLYCRVSTLEQVANLSLPTQEKACREYAAREGYEVAERFIDKGESAKTTQRPEFQRMLTYCRQQKGKVQAVIVYGLSRFSRNNADHHAIAALLRGQGIALRSVTEPIDDTAAGRFMEGILASMAQFDNDLRRDRTKTGMRAAVERGRWVWQAPIGYRTGSQARGEPSLVPHDLHAPMITSAFQAIADTDRTVSDVWRELQAAGVTMKRGHTLISLQGVHNTIRNPIYAGRLLSPGFGTDRRGDWIPLVSEDVWQRAQVRIGRDGRAAPRKVRNADFPLVRFMHCASCGRPLLGAWSQGRAKKYAYYRCRQNCVSTPKAVTEGAFLTFLEQLKPDAEYLALFRTDLLLAWRDECDRVRAQRASLEAESTKLRGHLRRLEDAFLFEQSIDEQTYSSRRAELWQRVTLNDLALHEAIVDTLDVEGLIAEAEYAITNGATLWASQRKVARRIRLQWALLPDGVLFDGTRVSNRGTRWACYHLPPSDGTHSRWASRTGAGLNRIALWATAWQAFHEAA